MTNKMLRRQKTTPQEDMKHTLWLGIPTAVVLLIILPLFLNHKVITPDDLRAWQEIFEGTERGEVLAR